ncbi:hypothetical protein [Pontibacter akesuensis]|uniref:Uncharacterized protein n=1 Tax=Pontibacter akesuensis TaxID=388950 RepID=A0A1I7KX54_9BACT|nr:hypothetical protein [Pontibacter akesuensis]GHA78594.1 hypothetical protein GCM10007389_36000 [Pontibacter akesuensis]SFV02049.1 hypothetical protein SAMN04487941_0067 [Pontibacter akesuensis]
MKPLFLVLFLISIFSGGISSVSRTNEYVQKAARFYTQEDYVAAIAAYEYLLHDLEVKDDQLQLNLAHSYYQAGLYPQALAAYQLLANHPTQHLRSLTQLQIGNLFSKQKKYKRALSLYRQSLITEPENEEARYNYELLKKYLELHPEAAKEEEQAPAPKEETPAEPDGLQSPPPAEENIEPQPKQNPDPQGDRQEEVEKPEQDPTGAQQQNAGASEQDNPAGNRDREEAVGSTAGDTKGQNQNSSFDPNGPRSSNAESVSAADQRAQTRRSRLEQANMSPEKAKLLLDAMRNAELQYIQQLPKKATTAPDPSKPDW